MGVINVLTTATQSQLLSVTSLPELLFSAESQTLAPQSVLWLYCEVTNHTTGSPLTVTWFKDNSTLVQNIPHLRLRTYTSGNSFRLALIVEPFQSADNGVYHCTAEQTNTITTGSQLTLRGTVRCAINC